MSSGFYGRDMRRKPVLDTLEGLINTAWKTHLSLTAAADGSVSFRGFKGDYAVSGVGKDGADRMVRISVR